MADQQVPKNDPRNLLSETGDLTRRVRLTQRGAWLPLIVLAAVTLTAIPFYRYGHHSAHCSTTGRRNVCFVYPTPALWYWPVALLVGYAAISWFYVDRSRRSGVGTRVRPYVVVGAILGAFSTPWVLWAHTHPELLSAPLHLGTSQATGVLSWIASPAAAIGLALLLLAWIERSRPLLALTVVYLIVNVPMVHIGSFAHPSPWAFLPRLLLDGGVLVIGGVILVLVQRAQASSTT